MGVKIDRLKCTGCGACTYECPVGVLSIVDMKCHVTEGCISCGKCAQECPVACIGDFRQLRREAKKRNAPAGKDEPAEQAA